MRRAASRWSSRAMCLWPGLPQLWQQGAWSGLALAVGFSALLNGLVSATILWDELLPLGWSRAAWVALVVGWGAWIAFSLRKELPVEASEPAQDLFREATNEYLKGNWFVAEALCRKMLARNEHDVDAWLMLATLLRHTRRRDDARRTLEHLATLDGCGKWAVEIADEWRRLKESNEKTEQDTHPAAPETPSLRVAA